MDIIKKYSYQIGGTFIIVVFVVVWKFFYKYILRRPKEDESEQEEELKSCKLMFFYTTWCPYCKKARVEWDGFKQHWNHKKIDGYLLSFSEIDCDTHEDVAQKYNVVGYPTILLTKNDKVSIYDAKPDIEHLNKFLTSCFS
jgi:thiol-disulfide isomerase/thioredoxin